tara:strand:- start:5029 stop:5187 length:159 start_codon:yes stop_codon:yes gene_type:complete
METRQLSSRSNAEKFVRDLEKRTDVTWIGEIVKMLGPNQRTVVYSVDYERNV